jgi:hypothetical protein
VIAKRCAFYKTPTGQSSAFGAATILSLQREPWSSWF